MLRRFGLVGLVICAAVVVGGPAWAHVSVSPDSAPRGSFTVLTFRVPNEEDAANTTQLVVQFPSDNPIASASVEPVPGWTVKVDKVPLDPPVQTEFGEVTEAISQLTWSGGEIAPGEFQRFAVSVGLPAEGDTLEFKALQTYDNGEVVRWIQETPAGGEEPEFPAPVLTLTEGGDDHGATTTTAAATTPTTTGGGIASADLADKDDVDSAKTLGLVGVIVGVVGLLVAIAAVALGRRPRPT